MIDQLFVDIIDELCLVRSDQELADGLKWIDEQAAKRGVSVYEVAYEVITKHYANRKAKEWMNDRKPPTL